MLQSIDLVVEQDGNTPSIASATFTLNNPHGTALVTAGATTIPEAGRVRYSMLAATTESQTLSVNWRGIWAITDSGGTVHTVPEIYAVCRYVPVCPIVQQDLYDLHSELSGMYPKGQKNWYPQIRAGWIRYTQRLWTQQRRPELVVSQGSPRDYLLYDTLAGCFRSQITTDDRWSKLAKDYDSRASDEWSKLKFTYDTDDDGTADEQRSSTAVVMLTGARRRRYPRRY